jgi:hypothetical protein
MSHQQQNDSSLSDARLNANRQNAQMSSGPRTREGKSVSSQNALKTALTGRAVLLPNDDADRYQAHIQAFFDEITPVGQRETILTQSLADIAWRIERIASFEMILYAKARAFFANCYLDEPEPLRAQLIEFNIYQTHERELRNLQLQDGRLRRQRDRDNNDLRFLQSERKRLVHEKLELAAYASKQAKQEEKPFDPAALGFVFSIAEIDSFIALRQAEKAILAQGSPAVVTAFKRPKAA